MAILPLLCVVSVALTGLTKGAGVLPDGPLNATLGGTVMFTTTLTPPEKPFTFVEWKFGDQSIISTNTNATADYEGRVTLFTSTGSLELRNLVLSDCGEYRVLILPQGGSILEGTIRLEVYDGPENVNLSINVSKEYYVEGSNISLSCSAVSRPAAQFYWLLNGDNMTDTGPELKLVNIQMSQSGNYSCQAFNNKTLRYETSQLTAVTVLERISGAAVTSSTNLTIEGNSVNLTCDAAAGSNLTRLWRKDDSDLILTDNMALNEESRVLSFKSLSKTDSGKYSCEISNPVSNDRVQYIMIVNYGPENVQIDGPSKIDFGKTLTLTCSAESEPSASYTWTLNGTEIHNSSVFTKVITGLSYSGNYTCQAMNNITERRSSAVHQVTVTANPASPSVCSAGCIAGIVIACLVVIGAAVGCILYYIYKRKKWPQTSSNSNTVTTWAGDGQNNTGYSGSQELNYADVTIFQNRNGGRVHLGSQNETSDYAEVKTTSSDTGSTPPTYDDHMQRVERQAPQPGGYGVSVYAQVKKN